MVVPAADQVASPFGADVGGVNPALFSANADAEFDSWLTVGITDDAANRLGSVGIDFDSWTASAGMTVDNGAVFWMYPDNGPSGNVTVAQLTVPSASGGHAVMNAQGRGADDGDDSTDDNWVCTDARWQWTGR